MKRIVFVDEDRQSLDSLRVRLHGHRKDWDMEFVGNAAAALARMASRPCDLIVTESRLPDMSGVQLLERVCAQWPSTIRLVLSGDTREAQNLRLIPLVHRYLSKPCDTRELENAIARCFQLTALLSTPALLATVGRIERLPPIPRIYAQLRQALADPEVTPGAIAEIVGADPVIAAKVLQVVNSAFFRLARRVTTLERAVNYLGTASIRSLVLSAEVFANRPEQSPSSPLQCEDLQAHVRRVTVAARALTAGTPLSDDTTLAALLHDIGYWVILQECADDIEPAFSLAGRERIALHEAESRVMGSSHAEIGAYLLGLWGLPFNVIEAVAYHHRPAAVPQNGFDVLAAVAVSSVLVRDAPPRSPLYSDAAPVGIDDGYLRAVGAPFDWSEAKRRVHAAIEEDQIS